MPTSVRSEREQAGPQRLRETTRAWTNARKAAKTSPARSTVPVIAPSNVKRPSGSGVVLTPRCRRYARTWSISPALTAVSRSTAQR